LPSDPVGFNVLAVDKRLEWGSFIYSSTIAFIQSINMSTHFLLHPPLDLVAQWVINYEDNFWMIRFWFDDVLWMIKGPAAVCFWHYAWDV